MTNQKKSEPDGSNTDQEKDDVEDRKVPETPRRGQTFNGRGTEKRG